jgi:heme/copper-type cytochrome/quinol oxidase subunit 2
VEKYGQESKLWRGVFYSGDFLWRPYVPVRKDKMMMMMMMMMVIMMIMITIMTTTTGVVGILRKDRGKDRSEEKARKKT